MKAILIREPKYQMDIKQFTDSEPPLEYNELDKPKFSHYEAENQFDALCLAYDGLVATKGKEKP